MRAHARVHALCHRPNMHWASSLQQPGHITCTRNKRTRFRHRDGFPPLFSWILTPFSLFFLFFFQGAEREDCFDEAEGLEFLAGEVGLEAGALSTEGAEIAALVGYQKVRWSVKALRAPSRHCRDARVDVRLRPCTT